MAHRQNLEVREKKRAALLSVASAVVLLTLKTFLVIRTGSLGVLSEALHSGLDLLASIITFLSVRMSDQPADERHPYGHGKFENFSAFVETALLIITAVFIIYEGFDRLFFHHVHIEPSILALVILLVALGIDLTRAKALGHVARKYHSEAIEADALHFSTDVWSTMVVIVGIGLVWAGEFWQLPWLVYADAIAGLVVAAVILWVGSQLGKRTLDALVDAAPEGLRQEIARAVGRMEGVLDVDRVRVRRSGNRSASAHLGPALRHRRRRRRRGGETRVPSLPQRGRGDRSHRHCRGRRRRHQPRRVEGQHPGQFGHLGPALLQLDSLLPRLRLRRGIVRIGLLG